MATLAVSGMRRAASLLRGSSGSLALAVLALLMVGYAVWPWSRGANLLANDVVPLLALAYLLAYFWGWGSIVGRLCRFWSPATPAPPLALLALGICAAATWLLLTGMLGGLRLAIFVPVSVVVIALGLWLVPIPRPVRLSTGWTLPEWTLVLAIGAFVLYQLVDGLMPEVPVVSWDAIAYHFAMGKIFLRHGRIEGLPWMPQSNFPLGTDLVFFHGLLVGGVPVALLLNLVLYLLCAAAVYRMARLFARRVHALTVTLAFLLTPESKNWIHNGYVEIGWMCFATLSLWCGLEWHRQRENRSWLFLAAIFSGFAVATKVTASFGAVAVGLLILAWSWQRNRLLASLVPFGKFTLVSLLVASPTYWKAYLYCGTPIWPLTFGIFELRHWNAEIQARAVAWTTAIAGAPPFSVENFLLMPWTLRHDLKFALLIFLVLAVVPRRRIWRDAAPFVVVALAGYLVVCTVTTQGRFLLPAVPAILLGLLVATRPPVAERRVAGAAFAVFWVGVLMLSLPAWLTPFRMPFDLWALVSGTFSREDYLAHDPLYRASAMVNAHTRPQDRLLLFGEVRGYYLDREYAWGDPLAQIEVYYPRLPTPAALDAELRRQGFTHVLYARPRQLNEIYPETPVVLMETYLLGARMVSSRDGYQLYDIRDLDPCGWTGTAAALVRAGIRSDASPPGKDPLLAAPEPFPNLLQNGSFEDGFASWLNELPAGVVLVSGGLESPTAVHVKGPAGALGSNFSQLRQRIAVEPGRQYIAGAYFRTRDVGYLRNFGVTLEVVGFGTAGRESWRASKALSGTQDWTLVSVIFQVPPGVREVQLFAPRVPRFYDGEVTMDRAFFWEVASCRGTSPA